MQNKIEYIDNSISFFINPKININITEHSMECIDVEFQIILFLDKSKGWIIDCIEITDIGQFYFLEQTFEGHEDISKITKTLKEIGLDIWSLVESKCMERMKQVAKYYIDTLNKNISNDVKPFI